MRHQLEGPHRAGRRLSATGTWTRPFWPGYPGARDFAGRQLHTVEYRTPEEFAGQRVVVVGGGNSGAQILAEVSTVADTTWVTPRPPRLLPDDVDGRALFAAATERVRAPPPGTATPAAWAASATSSWSPSVRRAPEIAAYSRPRPMFARLTADRRRLARRHRRSAVDAIIWCTGFRPALRHLAPLRLRAGGRDTPADRGTQAIDEPRLHLVGYGDWTGAASATLIGVGRTARDTVPVILQQLHDGR